ncbi:beta-1,4-galactosyltransferase 4-like [Lingula anatina]|uniref:Beta-1,4-galactosyltransferase n=1 Tax=Lingula anatina TaxID=7574 RepID=A0A1S3HA19_LINAN|nr:beta-1,4-galactosyltransferase 4-like [Lingula anatina]|eukprot:XP_013382853.1 beta-1,4-galactosyltransferase 4-like [Lingula anatina]
MRRISKNLWPVTIHKERGNMHVNVVHVLVGLVIFQVVLNVFYLASLARPSRECEDGIVKSASAYNARRGKRTGNLEELEKSQELCLAYPHTLVGRITIDVNVTSTLEDIKHAMPAMTWGKWQPTDCKSSHRVAIIIPYRNRRHHLCLLLRYLHPFLQRQQLHYRIFLAEQAGVGTWNKGRVMNAGYLEAAKLFDFQCVIFHDVDLVPEDDRNSYGCHDTPLHMSSAPSQDKYKTLYKSLVGGVLKFPREHFLKVNGYSNEYWGWGGEDDDMALRLKASVFGFERVDLALGRYTSLTHENRDTNPRRMALLKNAKSKKNSDGVSAIPYHVEAVTDEKLYTHILISI